VLHMKSALQYSVSGLFKLNTGTLDVWEVCHQISSCMSSWRERSIIRLDYYYFFIINIFLQTQGNAVVESIFAIYWGNWTSTVLNNYSTGALDMKWEITNELPCAELIVFTSYSTSGSEIIVLSDSQLQ